MQSHNRTIHHRFVDILRPGQSNVHPSNCAIGQQLPESILISASAMQDISDDQRAALHQKLKVYGPA